MHCNVVSNFLAATCAKLYEHADFTAHMDIALESVVTNFVLNKSSDSDFFTDFSYCLGKSYAHTFGNFFSGLNVVFCDILSYFVNECLVLFAASNEVGFTVYFYEYCVLSVAVCLYDTLRCNLTCTLCAGSHTFFSEDFDCLFHISVSFGKSLFAVHHTYAGLCTQIHYVFICKCHLWLSSKIILLRERQLPQREQPLCFLLRSLPLRRK